MILIGQFFTVGSPASLFLERTCEANPAGENSSFILHIMSKLFHLIVYNLSR